jgi:NifB/MoaA-like Fe-S oxidoreductase
MNQYIDREVTTATLEPINEWFRRKIRKCNSRLIARFPRIQNAMVKHYEREYVRRIEKVFKNANNGR